MNILIKYIKMFFKSFDYFGTTIQFRYKKQKKYHSATSGIIFLSFIIISFIYIFINILPFLQKKYMSIIYYNNHIYKTDIMNLKNYSFTFAFGIENEGVINSEDLLNNFSLALNYVVLNRTGGAYLKNKTKIGYKFCNKSDFYYKHNSTFTFLNLQNLFCLNSYDFDISGFYSDILYQYLELNLNVKNTDNFAHYKYLSTNSDLKLVLYYTDFSINLNDHKNPELSFLDEVFIQIQPSILTKQEIYFNLYKFENYENLIFNSHTDSYHIGFSRTHEYLMYKGEDRFETKIDDYDKLAKFFIRADTKRTMIERHYMKFTEFIANNVAIFNGVLLLLNMLMDLFNTFFAFNNIMKNIYVFKDDKKSSNLKQKEIFLEKIKFFSVLPNQEYVYNNNNSNHYNINNNHCKINYSKKYSINSSEDCCSKFDIKSENILLSKSKSKIIKKINLIFDNKLNYSNSNKDIIYKYDNNSKSKHEYESSNINIVNIRSMITKKEKLNVHFKFSVFEFLMIKFFPCFVWKQLKIKNSLLLKGNTLLYHQLDILTYLKNLLYFQMMNYILLESYQNNLIKVLSKPTISHNFNHNYYINTETKTLNNEDFLELNKIKNKSNQSAMEKRIINILDNNIKEIL